MYMAQVISFCFGYSFFVNFYCVIESPSMQHSHSSPNKFDFIVWDVKPVSVVCFNFVVNPKEHGIREFVVLGSLREPDLQSLPSDDTNEQPSDAGKSVTVDDLQNSIAQWFANFLLWLLIGMILGVALPMFDRLV